MTERLLHEPLALASLVLAQEYGAQLGQGVSPDVVERPEDALPVGDRRRENDRMQLQPSRAGSKRLPQACATAT